MSVSTEPHASHGKTRAVASTLAVTTAAPSRMKEVSNRYPLWPRRTPAAERIVERRQAELGRLANAADYARSVHHEAQALRHRSHERLMRAFLEPEVFEGNVRVERDRIAPRTRQASLPGAS